MKDSPFMEKRIVKDTTRRDKVYYNIYCNNEYISDMSLEQLDELYGIIGQYMKEEGDKR